MASLLLKPERSSFTMRPVLGNDPSPSRLIWALLLLNRITAIVLGGLGVMLLLANVFTGCALLLQGPEFILELLIA